METFTAHLADDAKPTTTLCGLPWEDWQDPDPVDTDDRPQHGDLVEQCQACRKASLSRS